MNRRKLLGWSAAGITGLLVPQVIEPRVSTFVMGNGFRATPHYKPKWFDMVPLSDGSHYIAAMHDKPPKLAPLLGTNRICVGGTHKEMLESAFWASWPSGRIRFEELPGPWRNS